MDSFFIRHPKSLFPSGVAGMVGAEAGIANGQSHRTFIGTLSFPVLVSRTGCRPVLV